LRQAVARCNGLAGDRLSSGEREAIMTHQAPLEHRARLVLRRQLGEYFSNQAPGP
jgi:hypothetical protein